VKDCLFFKKRDFKGAGTVICGSRKNSNEDKSDLQKTQQKRSWTKIDIKIKGNSIQKNFEFQKEQILQFIY